MEKKKSLLKRALHKMPDYVKEALDQHSLMSAFDDRPPYQRNDYLGWISRAKREETRRKRLNQMLDELRKGDAYMNMQYKAKKK